MESLPDLLHNRTMRELGTVAHCYGLPFDNKLPKLVARDRLITQLRSGAYLKRAWKTLSAEERDALRALQAADGGLPLDKFTPDFGVRRPYRPWADDGDRLAWKHPASIAEKLWYMGFIEYTKTHVFLCADAFAVLPPLPAIVPLPGSSIRLDNASDLLHDVAALLGILAGQSIRVVYKRFLPPRVLRLINDRLSQPEPDRQVIRSERQTGRLRWLHYLAECAGLVHIADGVLSLSVQAWDWLAESPDVQWARLMAAIETDLDRRQPLWAIYKLPKTDKTLWVAIRQAFGALMAGRSYRVRGFVRQLRLHIPNVVTEQVRALLNGPLAWSGQVGLDNDQRIFALLVSTPPVFPIPEAASMTLKRDALHITVPAFPKLRPVVEMCDWAVVEGGGLQSLRIDRVALERACRQQIPLTQIASALCELTGNRLPPPIYDQLSYWYAQCGQLRIEQVTVLRAADPNLLRDLVGERGVRSLLDGIISPHYAAVKHDKIEALTRKLAGRGLVAESASDETARTHAPSHAAYSWLAMRVYQECSVLFPQAIRLPGAISDDLKILLTSAEQHDLEAAAQALIDTIRRAVRGDVMGFVPPSITADSPDAIQSAIERAYAQQIPITIDYFSPVDGVPTRRTITPLLPIRWQGTIGYVEALCQRADAPRTFRLDRILSIDPE